MSHDLDQLMDFAQQAARSAGLITLEHFGASTVEFKGDGSEVTVADRAAENFLREAIQEAYPGHGVFAEEGSNVATDGAYRWIVDPIDGTRSFAAGVPLYGVLLALEFEGRPILGCCHFPVLEQTLIAADGAGCWSAGRRVEVSSCDDVRDARILTSGLEYWRDWATPAAVAGFDRLLARARFGRTWGDCFGYAMVASGRAEILADPACGAYWDYAPMIPIMKESGGRFTTLSGGPVMAWSSALASNGHLHGVASSCWADLSGDDEIQTPLVASRREH